VVTFGHFGHVTKLAVTPFDQPQPIKNPTDHTNFMALCFTEPQLLPMEV